MSQVYKIALLLISLTLIYSCSNENNDPPNDVINPAKKNDTTIVLKILGTPMKVSLSKDTRIDFVNFQKFLDDHGNSPYYFDTTLIDLTGDKKVETITKSISCDSTSCKLIIAITQSGKTIYSDTLRSDDDYFIMEYWDYDQAYFDLKPWSAFYHMMDYTDILLEEETPVINSDLREFYLNTKSNELKEAFQDSIKISKELKATEKQIDNYKGRLIKSMSLMDEDILFWNEKTKQFEVLYSP